mgnify:CR=1 FL=1
MEDELVNKPKPLDEILGHISKGDLNQALEKLNHNFPSREASILSSRFINLEDIKLHGALDNREYLIEFNKIQKDLFDVVFKLQNPRVRGELTP